MADATSRPMKVPITFVPYLEKYRIYELFQELLSRIIIKRPDDHLQFLKKEILDIVQPPILRKSSEYKVIEESKGSESFSSHSIDESLDDGMNMEDEKQRTESDSMAEDVSEIVGRIETIQGSTDYHMDETLASMNEEEFKKFSEEVISNWRNIKRSNKFFNIRELPTNQHIQEKNLHADDNDTKTDEESNGSKSITLIFHTRESTNEIAKENSQLHMIGSADGSNLKLNQSARNLDIKIKIGETVSSDTNMMNVSDEEILTVSYYETDNKASVDKKGSNEEIVHVKLLEGIPSNNSREIKEYIMKLIEETVEEIILALPKNSFPNINLNFFRQLKMPKKMIHFPRGPIIIPRVVLLGPPASGKHLQAKLLAKVLKLIHVDMGLLLLGWDTTGGKSEIRSLIRKSSLRGEHLMNEFSNSIVQERLLKEDCLKNGWVLTGYPTTAAHARALDNMETPPNRIIYLDKPLDQCRELLATRVYDVDTGEVGFLQPKPPRRQDIQSRSAELMSNIENVIDVFGIPTGPADDVHGYLMELYKGNQKEGHGLFENILESLYHRKLLLRSPEDNPKLVELKFMDHDTYKNELLKYYGGWCTKLNVDSKPPKRVHEAILSVVTGPFPTFEEASIGDRSAEFKLDSIYKFGNQVEAKLKLEMINFFS